MENPCYECLMVPICRNKTLNILVLDCRPLYDYLTNWECFVPINSYRYIEIKPLQQRYKISKNNNGTCRWSRREKKSKFPFDVDYTEVFHLHSYQFKGRKTP